MAEPNVNAPDAQDLTEDELAELESRTRRFVEARTRYMRDPSDDDLTERALAELRRRRMHEVSASIGERPTRSFSAAWVLNQLAGMHFTSQSGRDAYDVMKAAMGGDAELNENEKGWRHYWRCPCGAGHSRGYFPVGTTNHRCLRCGYVGAGGITVARCDDCAPEFGCWNNGAEPCRKEPLPEPVSIGTAALPQPCGAFVAPGADSPYCASCGWRSGAHSTVGIQSLVDRVTRPKNLGAVPVVLDDNKDMLDELDRVFGAVGIGFTYKGQAVTAQSIRDVVTQRQGDTPADAVAELENIAVVVQQHADSAASLNPTTAMRVARRLSAAAATVLQRGMKR